jgi:hypothetical protein
MYVPARRSTGIYSRPNTTNDTTNDTINDTTRHDTAQA